MRENDPNRYKRIPGSARRYLDLETGESISRREYDKRRKEEKEDWGGIGEGDGYDDGDYYLDVVSAGGSTREE